MKYTVYKVTNQINGKEYIGKHQTENPNDDYLGSGKNLKRAIEKHGKDNFKKEILHVYDTEEEMNAKESELVTEEYCSGKDTYNLCPGGQGGWGYINSSEKKTDWNKNVSRSVKSKYGNDFYSMLVKQKFEKMTTEEYVKYCEETGKRLKLYRKDWTNCNHRDESKHKMSESQKLVNRFGNNNPTFETCWIKNPGTRECGRIQKVSIEKWLSKGWLPGKYQKDAKYIKIMDT